MVGISLCPTRSLFQIYEFILLLAFQIGVVSKQLPLLVIEHERRTDNKLLLLLNFKCNELLPVKNALKQSLPHLTNNLLIKIIRLSKHQLTHFILSDNKVRRCHKENYFRNSNHPSKNWFRNLLRLLSPNNWSSSSSSRKL